MQAPIAPVNMIGAIYHHTSMLANAITRARAQEQEKLNDRVVPLDYPNAEVELERLKSLQEWIDEERI